MNSPQPESHLFTAACIARALGVTKEAVKQALAGVAPAGELPIRGGLARAWTVEALPERIRVKLAEIAQRMGYRSADHLLSAPPQRWEPAVPITRMPGDKVQKARKLQQALRPFLIQAADTTTSAAEFEARGVWGYKEVFGYEVSTRHWRDLFNRTLERDKGELNWDRLDLFLDGSPITATAPAAAAVVDSSGDYRDLHAWLTHLKDPRNPTLDEMVYFWNHCFQVFDTALAEGKDAGRLKRLGVTFLGNNVPFMKGKNRHAIGVAWDRKYKKWADAKGDASALRDQRHEKSGHRRMIGISQADRDAIIQCAVFKYGGRLSQAWRNLLQRPDGISERLKEYYLANPASKSYVPETIRKAVSADIRNLYNIHHGPHEHKANGAHLARDWSGVHAGDWINADDLTQPVYFYEPDGNGWFNLMRGQVLVFIDLRSTMIMGYALQSERSYNARVIRTEITKICDRYGLPRRGFYFERGVWKNSKILVGVPDDGCSSWPEIEGGLRDLGLEFVHAQEARAKPVERVLGALQNLMEGIPGYVGRNEMVEKFERVQRAKLDVEARRAHPSKHFLPTDALESKIAECCIEYNHEAQGGKMTEGLSPEDAFERFNDPANPQIRLDANCRHLLASHRRPVKVTRNGIGLKFGKHDYIYRDENTGRLRGETVIAWFDPENPDLLAVTDMNRKNPFVVPRSHPIPAMDATEEEFEREMAHIKAHQGYAPARYRVLMSKYTPKFRPVLVDRNTMALSQTISAGKVADGARRAQDATDRRELGRLAGELNISPGIIDKPPGEAVESLKDWKEARWKMDEIIKQETL